MSRYLSLLIIISTVLISENSYSDERGERPGKKCVDFTRTGAPCPLSPHQRRLLENSEPRPPENEGGTETEPREPPEPEISTAPSYPEPAVVYRPDFPPLGEYSVAGTCVTDEAGPTVTLLDNETLSSAFNRLKAVAPNGGTLEIPYSVDTVQCDTLRMKSGKQPDGPVTIKGIPGPGGEQPRFYCRSDTRDGTVPRLEVSGSFISVSGEFSHAVNIENLHVDGYKKAISAPRTGRLVIRNNYFHHGLSDGITHSNNETGSNGLELEICGNEIAHFGQGNTIHNSYIHRSLGGAGDTGLDGNSSWNRLAYVDNVCHSSPYSHCLKSIANENLVVGNRMYTTLATDPSYTMRNGSTLVDLSACSINTITDNYLHSTKPEAGKFGNQIIGIRNRRTKLRGCDLPTAWSHDIPPKKIEGPVHTEKYWKDLKGEILFPTIVENNTIVADGEYGSKYYAITMYGTYPNHETTLGSPSCWLPTPDAWYERARVYADKNTYIGFEKGHVYRSRLIGHSYQNNCPEPYSDPDGPKPPGPGPSGKMIEAGANEVKQKQA